MKNGVALSAAGARRALLITSAALAPLISASAANAQGAGEEERISRDELVVTATRREEALGDVPMSISVLTGSELERIGAVEFVDYAVRIPNLSFSHSGSGMHGSRSIAIRGVVGSGTTGFYLDETPLFESLDPRVVDLERIEVLRGPQGTLYGARSMGGTIRLITRQPNVSETEMRLHGEYSVVKDGDSNYSIDGSINVPIIPEKAAIRALFYRTEQSGVLDRVPGVQPILASIDPTLTPSDFEPNKNVDDESVIGGAITGRLELADGDFVIAPRFQYQRVETDGFPFADVEADNLTLVRLFDLDETGEDEWRHASLTATLNAFRGQIVSATGYFDRDFRDQEDFSEVSVLFFGIPPSPAVIKRYGHEDRFVQELRYISDFGGPLEFTVGGFYSDTDRHSEFPPTPIEPFFDNVFGQVIDVNITELAFFGEATFKLTDRLQVVGGFRWFDNEVDFVGSDSGIITFNETYLGTQKEKAINPKFGVKADLTDDIIAYANAAKGFRIGGVNSFSQNLCAADLAALPGGINSYDSDSLWNYDAGVKGKLLGGRMNFDAAGYYIDWSNIQQVIALNSCGFAAVVNAGKAEIKGFELELNGEVAPGLSYSVGAGYADGEITDDGGFGALPVGSPLQQVPKWTVASSLEYEFQAMGNPTFIRGDFSYVGDSFSANNSSLSAPRLRPSYALLDLRTGMTFGPVEVSIFAKNVTDEAANFSDIPPLAAELPTRPRIVRNRPRTIGISFTLSR
ncbi:MAG: TonB-dependent receptor [Parvularculaceae bacterium]|nr:TonB-dependent receptor [Amphiplicatus sp.]HRX38578.1 TonB-dependent receptor [Parvularculaceae bacterium]